MYFHIGLVARSIYIQHALGYHRKEMLESSGSSPALENIMGSGSCMQRENKYWWERGELTGFKVDLGWTQNYVDKGTMRLVLPSTWIHWVIYCPHTLSLVCLSQAINTYVDEVGQQWSAPCEHCGLWMTNTSVRCPLLQIKGEQHQPRGMGGRITVFPVSGHKCRAKTMLKCSSIVCLSSFVCLTNEVYSDTGWETRREGENPTMAAGAPGQLIFAQQLLWQTSNSPLKKRGNCLLRNGSVTDT